jgi:thiamine pyrophosphate-dependent acetolactate synthase large subunit-like protein
MNGGELVAQVLREQQISFLFTLCGGHISPILVEAKKSNIKVIDTRHEANAVFAADAMARITGKPGVVAVTAGPGITNTITAIHNALMAQSPVILLGGAAPTLLKGRGALQDIDQMKLIKPNVKWAGAVRRRKEIYPLLTFSLHAGRRVPRRHEALP